MCGIVGVFTHAPAAPRHAGWVAAATALMQRRGPDDEGSWTGHHVALGFRRLSVLDLTAAGHQPMTTADHRAILVFNGELYNHRTLRSELRKEGVRFRSTSDTEVALHALRQWGSAALRRFDGMFALGYYDVDRRQLLLARDAVGIKPLYVLEHRDGIVFGSQYDQVVRHPWCERQRIDLQALGSFLRLGWIPPPEGLIQGTNMLEPGTSLTVEPGRPLRSNTFRRFFDSPAEEFSTRRRTKELLDEALTSSVELQLVSDVPVGVFLSGGIDSPLVAAEARRQSPTVPSFTIGSEDPSHDETADARRYANVIGTLHVERTLTSSQAILRSEELVQAYSEPFSDFSALPTLLVSELARETVTVALSGDGGDELFWGYPRFPKVADAAGWFRIPRVIRMAGRQALRIDARRRPPAGIDSSTVGDWYLNAHSYFRKRWLQRVAPDVARVWSVPADFHYQGDFDRRSLLLWMRRIEWHYHLPMILLKVDRASMYHGLEVRVPLLSNAMNNVAEQTDPLDCIDNSVGKLPLRTALSDRVGEELVTGSKRGFSAPLGDWLRLDFRDLVQQCISGGAGFGSGLFQADELAEMYKDHLSGRRDHTKSLWAVCCLQRWADHHLRPLVPTGASGTGFKLDQVT